jgi:hypothetical protein
VSLELPEYDMKLRICRKRAAVNKYQFQTADYTTEQKAIIEKERKKLKEEKNIIIYSPEDKTLKSIEKALRE